MPSFSEWIDVQDLHGLSMGLEDPALDDRTAALSRRAEILRTESHRLDDAIARTRRALTETRGEGEAESGAIKVTVDAQNRVVDIALSAKAMRLPSTDRLRKALLTACDAAVADVERKLREAAEVDPDGDPLEAFFTGLPEIEALLPASLRAPRPTTDPASTEEHDG